MTNFLKHFLPVLLALLFIDLGEHTIFCDGTMHEKSWINNTERPLSLIRAMPRAGLDLGSTQDFYHIIYLTRDTSDTAIPVAMQEGDASYRRGDDGAYNRLWDWREGDITVPPGWRIFTRYGCSAFLYNSDFRKTYLETRTTFRAYLWFK